MKFKKTLVRILLVAVIIISAYIFVAKVTHAQDQSSDQAELSGKLDQVLNNQRTMMDQIAAMREELNIVKIRVTQSQ